MKRDSLVTLRAPMLDSASQQVTGPKLIAAGGGIDDSVTLPAPKPA